MITSLVISKDTCVFDEISIKISRTNGLPGLTSEQLFEFWPKIMSKTYLVGFLTKYTCHSLFLTLLDQVPIVIQSCLYALTFRAFCSLFKFSLWTQKIWKLSNQEILHFLQMKLFLFFANCDMIKITSWVLQVKGIKKKWKCYWNCDTAPFMLDEGRMKDDE